LGPAERIIRTVDTGRATFAVGSCHGILWHPLVIEIALVALIAIFFVVLDRYTAACEKI